jgi:hypothetical protein
VDLEQQQIWDLSGTAASLQCSLGEDSGYTY